jgi:hypothetical protein
MTTRPTPEKQDITWTSGCEQEKAETRESGKGRRTRTVNAKKRVVQPITRSARRQPKLCSKLNSVHWPKPEDGVLRENPALAELGPTKAGAQRITTREVSPRAAACCAWLNFPLQYGWMNIVLRSWPEAAHDNIFRKQLPLRGRSYNTASYICKVHVCYLLYFTALRRSGDVCC